MYINFTQFSLVFAILISLLIPFAVIWLHPLSNIRFKKLLDNIVLLQSICIIFSFLSLSYAYLTSDFSVLNVFRNSHVAMPLIYKFAGIWGNHEGSMMLWLFILGIVNLILNQSKASTNEKIWISFAQIIITSSLIAYTILKSNPFVQLFPTPLEGGGFNPLLQDVGLAIHPPILYIGYVTTIVSFLVSISALINKKLSPQLLEIMQKWNLISWSFLTLGVSLGSWWAYRELGWGGYWFWDPVENASLLPWLTSSALIHSIYSTKKLATNYRATILLAIFTFLLSILTTFFVRSGVVTSVHSFANDPSRGAFILALLSCYSFVSLGVFALRAHYFHSAEKHSWASRFGGINISNILWVIAALIILLSLTYPLMLDLYDGSQITINGSFFEKTFIPLLLFILVIMSIALPSSWKAILPMHYKHFIYSIIIALVTLVIFSFLSIKLPSFISGLAFFSGSLVVIRMIFWIIQRASTPLTYKFYLIWLVHLAAGLFAIILSFVETNSQEILVNLKEGDKVTFAKFDIHYLKNENYAIDNYLVGKIILRVQKENVEISELDPQIRYYPVEKSQTSESAVYHSLFYDLYAVINEITKEGNVGMKFYFKPLISWLWAVCFVIFICGMLIFFNIRSKINEKKI